MADLSKFLQEEDSLFGAELGQRGGYIKFSNSGKRGSTKSFHISLEALYETLQDIYNHLDVFAKMQDYEEKQWRDNGASYFTDEVANATITVQTKPLFSTLSKLIKWSNPDEYQGVSTDQHIVLNDKTLSKTLSRLLSVIEMFTPKPIVKRTSAMHPLQVIYYGAPGTGKSYKIKNLEKGQGTKPVRTTFHPDSDYATFVGAYKPTMEVVPRYESSGTQVEEKRIVYNFIPQAFLKAYVQAWANYPEPQYLVIEEINRGNCAQIFGDLFQLLDRSATGFSEYPIAADSDISKYLSETFATDDMFAPDESERAEINELYKEEYTDVMADVRSGELLLLPKNLHILATMNTSDQSLFPIDSAFKRRWDWEYIPIRNANKGWVITASGKEWDWWTFLQCINEKIGSVTDSEDKKLGYFFVKPHNNHTISAETFVSKVVFYLWNDVFKDYGFNDKEFQTAEGAEMTFPMFYETDVEGQQVNEELVAQFLQNMVGEPLQDNSNEPATEETTGA